MSVRVRRVVVAIDTASRTVRVVREAVELASSLGVELEGLVVEDDALLTLAEHAFARRVGAAGTHALAQADLEREWRALAREVREALEREAREKQVRAQLSVERGEVERALRSRLALGDVVVVAWGGWTPRAIRGRAPVRVIYDGEEEAAERALDLGASLAGPDGALLVWMLPDGRRALELAAAIRARVADRVGRLRIAGVSDAAPITLRRAIAEEPGGFLIVPEGSELALRLAQRSLAARFPCSVVVVR